MDVIPVHHINLTVTATDNQLDRTRIVTTADPALNQLRHYIFHGCSNSQNDCNIIGITVKNLQLKMAWYSKHIDLLFLLHLEQSIFMQIFMRIFMQAT